MTRLALPALLLLASGATAIRQQYLDSHPQPTTTSTAPAAAHHHIKQAAATITAAAHLPSAAFASHCGEARSLVARCGDAESDAALSACLCCHGAGGGIYAPASVRRAAGSCSAYYAEASSREAIELLETLAGYCATTAGAAAICTKADPAKAVTATTTTTAMTGSAEIDRSCYSAKDLIAACVEETPKFAALPVASQAECVCYQSSIATTTWIPDLFDGYVNSCASWAKSSDPVVYSAYSSWTDMCTDEGDFLSAGRAVSTTSTSSTSTDYDGSLTFPSSTGWLAEFTEAAEDLVKATSVASSSSSSSVTAVYVTVTPSASTTTIPIVGGATIADAASTVIIAACSVALSGLWFIL
ncbi:hypothetical protein F4780DRAFT_366279 [Xylariomycetidae sp. FL0641]|nr:hypothetical protein F4780DRAFT_366279 [Xylariomycetidae sp. FL0641]